ncbi:hypothetical protein FGO68_gene17175 [Halteria grandinella]|uniref:Uncharacterized protein n=1 Tax=Halteria grandinella TaxID=5974 RepID=A0A8J8NCF9_HALGN|nr:hypothetical protein FGO68_gene17175 [Halteria grandinella]
MTSTAWSVSQRVQLVVVGTVRRMRVLFAMDVGTVTLRPPSEVTQTRVFLLLQVASLPSTLYPPLKAFFPFSYLGLQMDAQGPVYEAQDAVYSTVPFFICVVKVRRVSMMLVGNIAIALGGSGPGWPPVVPQIQLAVVFVFCWLGTVSCGRVSCIGLCLKRAELDINRERLLIKQIKVFIIILSQKYSALSSLIISVID